MKIIEKYKDKINGVLSTFDRIIIKGVKQLTDELNRSYIYLNSPKISKEATALQALEDNPVKSGLICTIATVELCSSLQAIQNKETQKLELRNVNRKKILRDFKRLSYHGRNIIFKRKGVHCYVISTKAI